MIWPRYGTDVVWISLGRGRWRVCRRPSNAMRRRYCLSMWVSRRIHCLLKQLNVVKTFPCRELVGDANLAMHMRPDVAYAVGECYRGSASYRDWQHVSWCCTYWSILRVFQVEAPSTSTCPVIQTELVTGSSGDPQPNILCLHVMNLWCGSLNCRSTFNLKATAPSKDISKSCKTILPHT